MEQEGRTLEGGKKKLYMMVTQDKYELPVFVTDSVKELAKFSGFKEGSIYTITSQYRRGQRKKSQFICVEV